MLCLHWTKPQRVPKRYEKPRHLPNRRTRNRGTSHVSDRAGLYIDAENLQNDGQDLVEALISNWPDTVPRLSRLTLYVRADWVEMWKLWATSRFPDLHVTVRGVQHFSFSSSKNSADIAIATAAVADLLLGRISHVVVMSDDRDFISLYLAIRDELGASEDSAGKVPFLWVITSRKHSVSETAKQFFPPALLHVLSVDSGLAESPDAPAVGISTNSSIRQKEWDDIWAQMAMSVVETIPVGAFKSTDCQAIIKQQWPQHPMASATGPAFGTEFQKQIWPILREWGVTIPNPGKKPIRYEMTDIAKKALSEIDSAI